MAGLSPRPELHLDGRSLVPLLRGGASIDREALFWHLPYYGTNGDFPGSAVRAGDYKLIEFFEDGRLELYNLRQDIEERNNVAQWHPALTRNLHRMLVEWRESVHARIPARNPSFESEMQGF